MVAITATSSATPTLQAAVGRSRLEQARREADQAEANAKDLRAQANEAEQQAQNSQANLRKLSAQTRQDEPTYSRPRSGSTSEVPLKVQKLIERMYAATSEQRAATGNDLRSDNNMSLVVNSQGQSTGRVVNLSV
jgi:hypothetical protein